MPSSLRVVALASTLAGALSLAPIGPRAWCEPAPVADAARLRALVQALATPDLAGRGQDETREKAAALLVDAMRTTGAAPVPGTSGYGMPLAARTGVPAGVNVLGWVAGTLATEHVVLAASYDGRPPTAKETFFGADEHASGVAAVLEAARILAAGPAPSRSVLVALLDLSDYRDSGARAFLDAAPGAPSRAVATVVAERLGRSLGDAMPGALFVLGAERGEGLAPTIEALAPPAGGALYPLALDLHAEPTSTALPFEERGGVVLLVTAGASKDDGTPLDVADRVDAASLATRTDALVRVVRALADAQPAPALVASPRPRIEEARTLRRLALDLLGRARALALEERRLTIVRALLAALDAAIARGTPTAGDRVAIRLLALQVFGGLQGRDR